VVGPCPVDARRVAATPDVAAPDHDGDLHPDVDDVPQLPGKERGGVGGDAVAGVRWSERVAGELQQDPTVHGPGVIALRRLPIPHGRPLSRSPRPACTGRTDGRQLSRRPWTTPRRAVAGSSCPAPSRRAGPPGPW